MTPITDTLPDPASPAMRKAATSLILNQLSELVTQDTDWMAACRKRIKDRMSDAKHIIFNNDLKIRLIESQLEKGTAAAEGAPPVKTLIQEHQALTVKNHQLQRTAHVCALALKLMDQQAQAAVAISPKRKLEAVTPPKTVSS
ncbi:hypothetical protein [Rhodoferax mekongensis]|uniref:hypothetical protein n=1 Tax=Rhodoferax mekongensis TaxID=3068341 RepID=UPI0028BED9BC|nr:hypothetical protein [Rhodoferax sp. TBRC 17199]MDT7514603.1 hypothetical protein [Rhodoferax sp. TBRC 17199]